MGTTTSRPILHGLESVLLQFAQSIEYGIRFIERFVSSLFTLCLPTTLYHEFQLDEGRQVPVCEDGGMCYSPAIKVKQSIHFKQRYEERLKRRKLRAEWAAAGLDVVEMERQEQAKRKRQQQKAAIHQWNEKQHAEEMLGQVAKAPPARPELERETRAEREKGKLWVMGNVQPKQQQQQPSSSSSAEFKKNKKVTLLNAKGGIRLPSHGVRRATGLESVRETSFHEGMEYAMQGHGSRIASSNSEHGDISYQIVATSGDTEEGESPLQILQPVRRRKMITSQGILPASQSQTIALAASASRLDAATRPTSLPPLYPANSIPATTSFETQTSSPRSPVLIQPTAQRLRRSLDLVTMTGGGGAASPAGKDFFILDKRAESPRFFNRARASFELASNSPISSPGPFSSASSDAGSIASKRSIFGPGTTSISRSSTPPCVSDLANSACKSRWEASARERKVWKGEVDRIALHKLIQTSKRHHTHHQDNHSQKTSEWGGFYPNCPSIMSSEASNLALIAEKKLRRATLEPKQANKPIKVKRRSSSHKTSRKDV